MCELSHDHEPFSCCLECRHEVDRYGNTEEDFINCAFPDCGCDGERLCMAKSGASEDARCCNVEGMWSRTDSEALIARKTLITAVSMRIV